MSRKKEELHPVAKWCNEREIKGSARNMYYRMYSAGMSFDDMQERLEIFKNLEKKFNVEINTLMDLARAYGLEGTKITTFTNKISEVGLVKALSWIEIYIAKPSLEVTYNDITYSSLSHACKEQKVSPNRVRGLMAKGMTAQDAIAAAHKSYIDFRGKRYGTLKEWAADYKIPYVLVKYHYADGKSLDEILKVVPQKHEKWQIELDGEILNLTQASARLGTSVKTLREFLRSGKSVDEFTIKSVRVFGEDYSSLAEACRDLEVDYSYIRTVIVRHKLTIEEAIIKARKEGKTQIRLHEYKDFTGEFLGVPYGDVLSKFNKTIKDIRYHLGQVDKYIEEILWQDSNYLGLDKAGKVVVRLMGEIQVISFKKYFDNYMPSDIDMKGVYIESKNFNCF